MIDNLHYNDATNIERILGVAIDWHVKKKLVGLEYLLFHNWLFILLFYVGVNRDDDKLASIHCVNSNRSLGCNIKCSLKLHILKRNNNSIFNLF